MRMRMTVEVPSETADFVQDRMTREAKAIVDMLADYGTPASVLISDDFGLHVEVGGCAG